MYCPVQDCTDTSADNNGDQDQIINMLVRIIVGKEMTRTDTSLNCSWKRNDKIQIKKPLQ